MEFFLIDSLSDCRAEVGDDLGFEVTQLIKLTPWPSSCFIETGLLIGVEGSDVSVGEISFRHRAFAEALNDDNSSSAFLDIESSSSTMNDDSFADGCVKCANCV